ncbi:MAG: hypothetical protein ACREH6_12280 [Geminicoccaceae bacterium]
MRDSLASLLRSALVASLLAAPSLAASAAKTQRLSPAERCAGLIGLFDEIIQSRFDYRILKLEDYELDEARRLRRSAEASCAAGHYDFGLADIDRALARIGLPSGEETHPPSE